MGLEQTKTRAASLMRTVGKSAMAALYPDDFECYITALELVDSSEKTTDYFLFPLNPTSISESENQILNIRKTAGGINTISTETFMPSIINMSGNFGRKFKILVGNNLVDFKAFNFSEKTFNQSAKIFDDTVKTGYGCIKILQKIIQKSRQLDQNGQPYFLYLYNLNFGKIFLVKCIGQPTFSTSVDKNMIWDYNIQFQTLAELSNIKSKSEKNSNLKLLGISTIQKGLNAVLGNVLTTSTRS